MDNTDNSITAAELGPQYIGRTIGFQTVAADRGPDEQVNVIGTLEFLMVDPGQAPKDTNPGTPSSVGLKLSNTIFSLAPDHQVEVY